MDSLIQNKLQGLISESISKMRFAKDQQRLSRDPKKQFYWLAKAETHLEIIEAIFKVFPEFREQYKNKLS